MKKVYVAHSRKLDFKQELYSPIRSSSLDKKYDFILPHEFSESPYPSKNLLQSKTCLALVAEASYVSTGYILEVAWADAFEVPIILMHRKGTTISDAFNCLTDIEIIEYESLEDMVSQLDSALGLIKNKERD